LVGWDFLTDFTVLTERSFMYFRWLQNKNLQHFTAKEFKRERLVIRVM
jgi:hypothetical protein